MTAVEVERGAPTATSGRRARAGQRWSLLAYPAIVFTCVVFVVPVALIAWESFANPSLSLHNYASALDAVYVRVLVRTIVFAAICAALSLLLGYPLAYAIYRSGPRVQQLMLVCVITPYMTSILVRTFAWEVLFGRIGPIPTLLRKFGTGTQSLLGTNTAVLIGLVQITLPIMTLILFSGMQSVDRSIGRAAHSLGAGKAETFWTVFVPQTRSGVEAGVALTFISAIGSYFTPQVLGSSSSTMTGVVIEQQLTTLANFGGASAFAMLLTLVVLVALVAARLATRRGGRWIDARAGEQVRSRDRRRRWAPVRAGARWLDRRGMKSYRPFNLAFGWLIVVYLMVPQLISIPISLSRTQTLIFPPPGYGTRWYRNFFTAEWLKPAEMSLLVALVGAAFATVLGGCAAMGVIRGMRGWARGVTTLLLTIPIVLPLVVSSLGFFLGFVRVNLVDTYLALVLAEISVVLPLPFVIVASAVRAIDPVYERAAASLGASRLRVIRRVTLPMLVPALIVSFAFAFLFIFDDALVPLFISVVNVEVLPLKLYQSIAVEPNPVIGVVGTLSLVLALIITLAALILQKRSRSNVLPWSTLSSDDVAGLAESLEPQEAPQESGSPSRVRSGAEQ